MNNAEKPRRKLPLKWMLLVLLILVIGVWLYLTPPGLLGKAGAVGASVCHRIEERSFDIHGHTSPLCARCTGMFLGALLALVFHLMQGRAAKLPPWYVFVILGIWVVSFALDGLNSFTNLIPGLPSLYETQTWHRVVTGTGMGLVLGSTLVPLFHQSVWTHYDEKSALSGMGFLHLVGLSGVIIVAILIQSPWLLYPLALLSAAAVIILLAMIYTIVWVMIAKKENSYTCWGQLTAPLMAGLLTAMIQIGSIDLVRVLMFGHLNGIQIK